MNVKRIVFFALFSLVLTSLLFAKKVDNVPSIPLDNGLLQGGVWEVLNIGGDVYPMKEGGILMHMYFIFSNDGLLLMGAKFEDGKENVLARGNKNRKYVLKGAAIYLQGDELKYSLTKEGRLTLTDKDGSKIVLQAVDSPSIEEIKKAEPMDLGD